jgi:nicotine oxidoreductase
MKIIKYFLNIGNGYLIVPKLIKFWEVNKLNYSTKNSADSNARTNEIVENKSSIENLQPTYNKLFDKNIYIQAYDKIRSNPGNMTPGTDEETLDKFSLEEINKVIVEIKNRKFQFKPSRREYIKKPNGKLRPLGIPSPRDKIIQEVFRSILNPFYEKLFLNTSLGFRPNKSCHTALKEIKKWTGITWMIEGDIKGYFDNINHNKLEEILRNEIKDQNIIDLYWKYVKAGYIEEKKRINSLIGIPQGGVLSPLFSNIYLHEFDKFMENIIKEYTNISNGRSISTYNKEYIKQRQIYYKLKENYETSLIINQINNNQELNIKIQELKKDMIKARKKMLTIPAKFKTGFRVYYIRYADDWVVGISGPKTMAIKIKDLIREFLKKELLLELNEDKIKISHMVKEGAYFLGYQIKVSGRKYASSQRIGKGKEKKRASFGRIKLLVRINNVINKLNNKNFCNLKGIPNRFTKWIGLDIIEIVYRYESILTGILNYYKLADNFTLLHRIVYILKYSMIHTIANKLNLNTAKAFKKFGKYIKIPELGRNCKMVLNKPKDEYSEDLDPLKITEFKMRTHFLSSLLKEPCRICGKSKNIEMHHIKHLKKVKLIGFNEIMKGLNRKQIPVCKNCHNKIHKGLYDGLALKDLYKSNRTS